MLQRGSDWFKGWSSWFNDHRHSVDNEFRYDWRLVDSRFRYGGMHDAGMVDTGFMYGSGLSIFQFLFCYFRETILFIETWNRKYSYRNHTWTQCQPCLHHAYHHSWTQCQSYLNSESTECRQPDHTLNQSSPRWNMNHPSGSWSDKIWETTESGLFYMVRDGSSWLSESISLSEDLSSTSRFISFSLTPLLCKIAG